jgi:hypothetical protein
MGKLHYGSDTKTHVYTGLVQVYKASCRQGSAGSKEHWQRKKAGGQ